jgi:hypothetical protein
MLELPPTTNHSAIVSEPPLALPQVSRPSTPIDEQPSTSASTSQTLRQFVSRQLEIERSVSDDESIISANNPQKCQLCGKRDTSAHRRACSERERESFSAKFKQTTCSVCLEHLGQARHDEIVFTPCGHVLHTRCYNNNRTLGVNPDHCPTCKRRIPQLYQLFLA